MATRKTNQEAISESELTLIGENTKIEGQIHFTGMTRVFGTLKGQIQADEGSSLILMESAVVEGSLDVDTVMIAGFVRGEIRAKRKILIEGTGRVIGNLHAPSIQVDFGAFVEGEVQMPSASSKGSGRPTSNLPNLPV